ncbi:MAG: pentapeptide repeat-containing protein [Xanthobacteraceae bacterium]
MADKTDKTIDPYDVEALEKSLNDSATRVSTIWVSFLIFSLYLLTAATTVTHRQLFLAEPVKLPVLNIELPLWGFFWLAPILFVIFHAYVLLQVILLARTAAAYNEALTRASERDSLSPEDNASLRQRLANTLFAQILAGSPREREGAFGWLLNAMAWITLAIAPILILLTFQFMFLPYHSHLATWTHRVLILLEFTLAFQLWPLVLSPQRDFQWPNLKRRLMQTAVHSLQLLRPGDGRRRAWQGFRQQAVPLAASVLFIFLSLSLATFPGEPHVNLATGHGWSSVQCDRWFAHKLDRLDLPRVDVVDDEKLAKIEEATSKRGLSAYQGERTRDFRDRDLNCAHLAFADLRRVDLASARLVGAQLDEADLQGALLNRAQLLGASFFRAQLRGASLDYTQLQGALLDRAQLQGASLRRAQLQSASLYGAQLQGAFLDAAELQGASLVAAQLQGASLGEAQLQGADLLGAELQGAFLVGTELQGASLVSARLQGAFVSADLQGALLFGTQLQGVDFSRSSMTHTHFSNAYVWRAKIATCADALVSSHKPDAIVDAASFGTEAVQATPDEIVKFIERSIANIPDGRENEEARERMRAGLIVDPTKNDTAAIEEIWSKCENTSAEPSQKEFSQKFDQNHINFLHKLVCENTRHSKAVAQGIIRNWISDNPASFDFSAQLARSLLGQGGKECAVMKDLDQSDRNRLRQFAPTSLPK